MGTKMRLARNFHSVVLGLGLLSLVFLGSPGCGCGEDNLRFEGGEPERCCCDFEWLPPRIANGRDVVISIENDDASLGADVTPSVLLSVSFTVPEEFTVCVSDEHFIGDSLELVLRDQVTNVVYTRVMLIYDVRCDPIIEPLSDYVGLTSTDCGEPETLQCCCEFEWLPGPNQVGNMTVSAENVDAGLNPVITPTVLLGVAAGGIELIDVCVDVDHPLGAEMQLVIRQQGSGALVGLVQLRYDARCDPTLVPTTAFPSLNITSTECGGEPLVCCCDFQWTPPVNYPGGNVNITAQNASPGLNVTITPSTINGVLPRLVYNFTVCINQDHNLLDQFELVIADTTGPELGRMQIVYRLRCDADIQGIPGTPSLILTTTDCGAEELLCCCDFEWIITDPDFNPPPGPWTVALENVDPSLEPATVSPTQITFLDIPPTTVLITICVNQFHTDGAAMELVITAPNPVSGPPIELARLPMDWTPRCTAQTGDPSGAGFWINLCDSIDEMVKPGR